MIFKFKRQSLFLRTTCVLQCTLNYNWIPLVQTPSQFSNSSFSIWNHWNSKPFPLDLTFSRLPYWFFGSKKRGSAELAYIEIFTRLFNFYIMPLDVIRVHSVTHSTLYVLSNYPITQEGRHVALQLLEQIMAFSKNLALLFIQLSHFDEVFANH